MCSNYDTVSRTERLRLHFGVGLPGGWQDDGAGQGDAPRQGATAGQRGAGRSEALDFGLHPSAAGGADAHGGRPVWPTQEAIFIRRQPLRDAAATPMASEEALVGRFGLVPHWATALDFGRRTYNARAETVVEKPSFRDAWRSGQRCIVPVEHIYEPRWSDGRAVPMRIGRSDGRPMGIAGLWACNRRASGTAVLSFTMLTVNADAHALFRTVHRPTDEKRMVVILAQEDHDGWLDASPTQALDYLRQFPADMLVATADPARGRRAG